MDSIATQVGGTSMKIHEIAQILPAMSEREYAELKASIEANGLMQPITANQGAILDGRHRERACRELGIEPKFVEYNGDDPLGYVVLMNVHRRHLSESQRAMIAVKIATMKQGARTDLPQICGKSQSVAATMVKVGIRTVQSAKKVVARGVPQLQKAVELDEIAVSEAAAIAELDPKVQHDILAAESKQERRQKIRQMRGSDSGVSAHENPKVHRWRTGLRRLQLFVTMREKEGGPGSILDGISGDHRQRWASQLRGIASVFQGWAQALDPTHPEATRPPGDGPAAIEPDRTSPGDQAVAPDSQQDGAEHIEADDQVVSTSNASGDRGAWKRHDKEFFAGRRKRPAEREQGDIAGAPAQED